MHDASSAFNAILGVGKIRASIYSTHAVRPPVFYSSVRTNSLPDWLLQV